MEALLFLSLLALCQLAGAEQHSGDQTTATTISTTVTVDWLFTRPGAASPTTSNTPYETYSSPPSTSSVSSVSYYPLSEDSSESQVGGTTPTVVRSCRYHTINPSVARTPTTLVTTKAVTITTTTTEAYSTMWGIDPAPTPISTSTSTYSYTCHGKHDPDCRKGFWTSSYAPAETIFTTVSSWAKKDRDVNTKVDENAVDAKYAGHGAKDEESGSSALVMWLGGLAFAFVFGLFCVGS